MHDTADSQFLELPYKCLNVYTWKISIFISMQDAEYPFTSRDLRYKDQRKVTAAAVEGSVKEPKKKVEGLGEKIGLQIMLIRWPRRLER